MSSGTGPGWCLLEGGVNCSGDGSVDVLDAGEALFFDIQPRLDSPGDGVIDRAGKAEPQECFPFPLEYGLAKRCFLLA